MRLLFILFLTVPLIEIYLLIQVGGVIGPLPTVGLIILTAIVGAGLLRWQGLSTMQRVRQALARGDIPAIEMFEGVILLFCGALLLTPGFFTDMIGFIGLLPLLRRSFILWLFSCSLFRAARGNAPQGVPPADFGRHSGHASSSRPVSGSAPRTIEGEFWRDDEKK